LHDNNVLSWHIAASLLQHNVQLITQLTNCQATTSGHTKLKWCQVIDK